ncbi:MAG: heme-binding protein [Clostridia bacterium]|nr:heme-binding protein [Clostridia bacterium]
MSTDIEKLVRAAVSEIVAKDAVNAMTKIREKKRIESISLDDAKFIASEVEKKAKEMGVNAVVAIADEGGNLKLCECMDNSYLASRDVAINKAYTVVALKMSTRKLAALAAPGESLYGIQFTNGGKIVIFGGGDYLEAHGKILGGLGVSGGSEEQDTALSAYGKKIFSEYFL